MYFIRISYAFHTPKKLKVYEMHTFCMYFIRLLYAFNVRKSIQKAYEMRRFQKKVFYTHFIRFSYAFQSQDDWNTHEKRTKVYEMRRNPYF